MCTKLLLWCDGGAIVESIKSAKCFKSRVRGIQILPQLIALWGDAVDDLSERRSDPNHNERPAWRLTYILLILLSAPKHRDKGVAQLNNNVEMIQSQVEV